MEQYQKQNLLISIKIKTLNSSLYQVSASIEDPVWTLQTQIEQKSGVPANKQRLVFRGQLLEMHRPLKEYRIQEGHVIQLIANRIPSQLSSRNSSNHRSTTSRNHNYSRQQQKYKKHKTIQQRAHGFTQFNNSQAVQTLAQNKHTIDQLLSCLNYNVQHEVLPFKIERRILEVGQWIDIKDASGNWVEGQITSHYGQYVLIHYNGYPDRWNQWLPVGSQRIMPFRTYTVQPQRSEYMSPFPINPRRISKHQNKGFQPQIQRFINELTHTIDGVNKLMKDLQFDQKSERELSVKNISLGIDNGLENNLDTIKMNLEEVKLHHQFSQKEKSQKEYKKQEFQTPSKDHPTIADNLSNKCEDNDNISNKCDNDVISNKSFKSKRSQGLVDTSSMKSLIIDQQRHKQKQNKIFFDYSQAQSVRSMKNKSHHRNHYVNHQEHILEQEDSQYNEDLQDANLHLEHKIKLHQKMRASQLAPLLDRLGRLCIDLAPHVAMMGHTEQISFNSTTTNENLSTFTNEGSLQSRLAKLQKRQRNNRFEQQTEDLHSHLLGPIYCQFQIPIMLTPSEISRISRLLEQQNSQLRNSLS